MNFKFLLILVFTFVASLSAFADVEITDLKFSKTENKGSLNIYFKGDLTDYPEMTVKDSFVQVSIPSSKVKSTIDRKVPFATKDLDTRLRAYQYNNSTSRIRAIVPFELNKMSDKVALTIKDNRIELTFPRVKVASNKFTAQKALKDVRKAPVKEAMAKPVLKKKPQEKLDKAYLDKLLKIDDKKVAKDGTKDAKDEVTTTLSSQQKIFNKDAKSSFSFMTYAGKFVAFLAVVLLLFYGVISLMKKGVIKKGKLGFLNSTDMVSVLSQTYVAPKKSLMLVKAHNQVFLLSNTDQGLQFVSEINDTTGLLKSGERKVAGNNFDDSLGTASLKPEEEVNVKIKEDIMESNRQSSLSDFLNVKDKVKFSDQLKKKVKNLKPLQ